LGDYFYGKGMVSQLTNGVGLADRFGIAIEVLEGNCS
jgi:hypothetical protein